MTRPTKVAAFLDVSSSSWNPSLAFVMGGAILAAFPAFQYVLHTIKRRKGARPICAPRFHLPIADTIDWRLVVGAAAFGVGWGLAGICPGPALVGLVRPSKQLMGWMLGMAGGMWTDILLAGAHPMHH